MTKNSPDTTVITGFHVIEETVRAVAEKEAGKKSGGNACRPGIRIFFSKEGPRVRKILALAEKNGIPCVKTDAGTLNSMVSSLPQELKDHRGIVCSLESVSGKNGLPDGARPFNIQMSLDSLMDSVKTLDSCLVLVLDSVTDPHNLGAVLRSADQFQASALIVPESRSAKDSGEENGVVARASAGASAWIPLVRTSNLVRAVERFKQAGFWVYGAEAGGQSVADVKLPDKTVFIMGSEGSGISRLLRENCDGFVSIPAAGRLDSLNVSVAAGILLYEFRRQKGYGLPLSY